jgi:ketosteroid isomerase-like protein
MSQENPEAVPEALRVRERSSRTLDRRLGLRFPRLAAVSFRLLDKLPRGSRLRRAALLRAVRLTSEAYNRRDLDAVVMGFRPEIEYHCGREWVRAGLVEPCYRGRDGYRRYVAATSEVWGDENYLEPVKVIDLGDGFLMLAYVRMRAQASGVPLTEEYAYVATLSDGGVIRLQEYFDHDEALRAVGLQKGVTPVPRAAGVRWS